jgi:hypothetical protein
MLADTVLAIHFLIAAFIAAGFVLIPLGAWRGWRFARHRGLRLWHVGGISFVALESIVGVACPLTVWESALRGGAAADGFIAHWVHRWLYYDVPPWIFGAVYIAAAAIALIGWRVVPPRTRSRTDPC